MVGGFRVRGSGSGRVSGPRSQVPGRQLRLGTWDLGSGTCPSSAAELAEEGDDLEDQRQPVEEVLGGDVAARGRFVRGRVVLGDGSGDLFGGHEAVEVA